MQLCRLRALFIVPCQTLISHIISPWKEAGSVLRCRAFGVIDAGQTRPILAWIGAGYIRVGWVGLSTGKRGTHACFLTFAVRENVATGEAACRQPNRRNECWNRGKGGDKNTRQSSQDTQVRPENFVNTGQCCSLATRLTPTATGRSRPVLSAPSLHPPTRNGLFHRYLEACAIIRFPFPNIASRFTPCCGEEEGFAVFRADECSPLPSDDSCRLLPATSRVFGRGRWKHVSVGYGKLLVGWVT